MSAILRTELSGPNVSVFMVETLPVLILFKMWLTTNDFIHTYIPLPSSKGETEDY